MITVLYCAEDDKNVVSDFPVMALSLVVVFLHVYAHLH